MNEPVLSVRDLRKDFGSNKVLKGIDFEVNPGQIIGYIGPNGAGKSTTVKIFLGILDQYQGEIEMFGEVLKNGDWEYKRRIGCQQCHGIQGSPVHAEGEGKDNILLFPYHGGR